MRVFELINNAYMKCVDRILLVRQLSDFNCGDCEQSERCGLPPDDKCVARAMHLARDGEM